MPVHDNHIGGNQFFDLVGQIFYAQQQVEIIQRPGVPGSGVRRLGSRGEPFEMLSIQYHASFAAAATAIQSYDDLPGLNPVELMRNSVDHGDYFVLAVHEMETIAVYNVVGAPGALVRQTVRWRLLA